MDSGLEAIAGDIEEEKPEWRRKRQGALTPKVADAIISSMQAGTSANIAFMAAGIKPSLGYGYITRGRKASPGSLLYDFARAFEEARAYCEDRYVSIIANASMENWVAATWMLERMAPERWGRKDKVTLEGDPEKPIIFGLDIKRVVIDRPEGHSLPPADVSGPAPDAGRQAPIPVRGVWDKDGKNGGNGSMDY